MTEHDRFREMVAAHVLGALDPGERAELAEHLPDCERCRREVLELAPIPALLSRLDVDDVEHLDGTPAEPAPERLVAAVRADVAGVARSRRRWRWATGVAAAAVAVVVIVTATADDAEPRRFDGVALDVELAAADATAEVVADEREWGTYVWLSAEDLPRRDGYTLWVVDHDGGWERAGSFSPTAGGRAAMGGSSRLALSAIDRIVVTSDDRTDEILVAR